MPFSAWFTPEPDVYLVNSYNHTTFRQQIFVTAPRGTPTGPLGDAAWANVDSKPVQDQSNLGDTSSVVLEGALVTDILVEPYPTGSAERRPYSSPSFNGDMFRNRFVWNPALIPEMAGLDPGKDYDVIPGHSAGDVNAYVDYEASVTVSLGWNVQVLLSPRASRSIENIIYSEHEWPLGGAPTHIAYALSANGDAIGSWSEDLGRYLSHAEDPAFSILSERTTPENQRQLDLTHLSPGSSVLTFRLTKTKPPGLFAPSIDPGRSGYEQRVSFSTISGASLVFQRPRLRYWKPESDVPRKKASTNRQLPLRQVQRGDGLGVGGVPRAVQRKTAQESLRRGPSTLS